MPKRTYKIQGFHGGMNTNADSRDVSDIESPSLQDVKISNIGKIKTLGAIAETATSNTLQILPNRGLFSMDSDRKVSDNGLSDETLIIVYDDGGDSFDVKDSNAWATAEISLDTSHPVFYSSDGILRVGDGALTENGKWYGYISGAKFDGLNADSADINDWISTNQVISTPTTGVCLISDPTVGSDGNTVNSTNSEYDGNIADASGTHEPLVHSAVNLRVGVQNTTVFENDATSWSRNSSSPLNATLSEPAETDIYPALGNNVLKFVGDSNETYNTIELNNNDGGTTLSYTINENQCLIYAVNISEAELEKLSYFSLTISTGSGYLIWEHSSEDMVANCWNFLVCNRDNFSLQDGETELDSTFKSFIIRAQQKFGGSYGTGNASNDAPDFYLCTPVLATNPSLEGYQSGVYTFHHTYLYDDSKQESLPKIFGDVPDTAFEPNKVNIVGGSVLFSFDAYVLPYNNAGTPAYSFNKRIVGSRLYYKVEENDNYFLIGELDFVNNGFKWLPESDTLDYSMTNSNHASGILAKAALIKDILPETSNVIDTFKSINGFSTEVSSLEAKYKTAVVHGRRTYIGNIKQDGENHSDRMLKSRINKFDTFPSKMGLVDVAIRDGESIVKLEAFADRILQFKQKSLYVINVSENIDFLEDVYRNKGCAFDYHVAKTDYGIAWFNAFGVYLFDGKSVKNLLEKDGMRIISESDWEAFITDGEDGSSDDIDMSSAHIGYIAKRRQLLIKNENSDVFIYDLVLRAWTKGIGKITVSTNMTNFALDSDQDLFYVTDTDSKIRTWNPDSSACSNFLYISKDIDFGEPAIRKKIYKVYITYKTGATTNVQVKYDVDGGITFNKTFQDGTNFASNILANAGGGAWTQAVLKPSTSTEANNIYSFALKFSSTGTGPEVTRIKCVADVSDSLNGKYFDIYGAGGKTEVWIDTDNSGTSAPSGSGSYAQTIEVTEIETNDSAEAVAIAVAEAVGDHANFTTRVEGETVIITDAASASRTNASDGDTGFTISIDKEGGTSSVPATFEINDISIVYRTKSIR